MVNSSSFLDLSQINQIGMDSGENNSLHHCGLGSIPNPGIT